LFWTVLASFVQNKLGEALASSVGGELTNRIEEFVQSKLGLTSFSIDLGVQQASRIRVGRKLYGPLYGSLTQEIGGMGQRSSSTSNGSPGNQQRWEVYYQFNPQLRAGYRRTQGAIENEKLRDLFFFGGSWSF
jgi:hypothetical protein